MPILSSGASLVLKHRRKWLRNRRFLSRIPPDFGDWLVTAAFYSALHATNALLASYLAPATFSSHTKRNDLLKRFPFRAGTNTPVLLWPLYQPLYNGSLVSRYVVEHRRGFSFADARSLVETYLYPLEVNILALMGRRHRLPPITWHDQ